MSNHIFEPDWTQPRRKLRVAVASDLHAYSSSSSAIAPSNYDIASPVNNGSDPLTKLKKFLNKEQITADLLLCLGDLGDKANTVAIKQAWSEILSLGQQLGSHDIFATPGNHDVDSRHEFNQHDPKGFLQSMTDYPSRYEHLSNQLWAKHYAIIEGQNLRLLIIDSSAFHGYHNFQEDQKKRESNHGRISEYTLNAIEEELKNNSSPPPVNIAICHHHPDHLAIKGDPDYDRMINGEQLIALLDNAAFGDWIILHGHKHHPRITNAKGANPPVVFSAGSLCATTYPAGKPNQFYILEFDVQDILANGFRGRFYSYNWSPGSDWKHSATDTGIPRMGGFGSSLKAAALAATIAALFSGQPVPIAVIRQSIPEFDFVLPEILVQCKGLLSSKHGLELIPDNDGEPYSLEKKP